MERKDSIRIDLTLSLRYELKPKESSRDIRLWKDSVEHASKLLFHATDKQVQLGRITLCKNSGGKCADGWLHELCGRSAAGYGGRMDLCRDEQKSPYIIVHELGHLIFNLRDEYQTEGGKTACCSGDPENSSFCIMEFPSKHGDRINLNTGIVSNGTIYEFCCDDNHKSCTTCGGDLVTIDQENSCWHTIVSLPGFTDLHVPAAGRAWSEDGHEAVEWEVTDTTQRLLLVARFGGGGDNQPVNEGILRGLHCWVTWFHLSRHWMGIVNAGPGDNPLLPVQDLGPPAARDRAYEVLQQSADNRHGDGDVSIGNSLEHFTNPRSCANPNLLVVDTSRAGPDIVDQNTVDGIASQLHQLRIRFHSIATRVSGSESLSELALKTKGSASFPGDRNDDRTRDHSAQIAAIRTLAECVDDTAIVAESPFVLPSNRDFLHLGWRSLDDANVSQHSTPGSIPAPLAFDQPVLVEQGCLSIWFVLVRESGASANMAILSPDGDLVLPNGNQASSLFDFPGQNYSLARIENPKAGVWTLRVFRSLEAAMETETGTLMAISENPHLAIDFSASHVPGKLAIRVQSGIWFGSRIDSSELPEIHVFPAREPTTHEEKALLRSPVSPAAKAIQTSSLDSRCNHGSNSVDIPVSSPGIYLVRARYRSAGTWRRSRDSCTESCRTGGMGLPWLAPPFERLVFRTVVVRR